MVLLNDIIFAKCALEHICHSFSFYYISWIITDVMGLLLILLHCNKSFKKMIIKTHWKHQKIFITVWSKDAFHL